VSGADFATINQWLGHECPNTTMRYAREAPGVTRRALAQAFADAVAPPPAGRVLLYGAGLLGCLRRQWKHMWRSPTLSCGGTVHRNVLLHISEKARFLYRDH
jgi:hypothetical protein